MTNNVLDNSSNLIHIPTKSKFEYILYGFPNNLFVYSWKLVNYFPIVEVTPLYAHLLARVTVQVVPENSRNT